MKSLKSKLMAAGAMLMVSVVMLTSASFAWFTVSTAPQVTNIEVEMTATKNLEIAKATDATKAPNEVTANDGADETKWGGKVTTFTAVKDLAVPATVGSGKIQTVTYTADGRTNGLTDASETALSSGIGDYKHNSSKCAVTYGVWLRTNETGNIKVTVTGVKVNDVAVADANSVVGLAFDVGGTITAATAKADGTFEASLGSLTANQAKLVKVIVYVEGSKVIAKDVASATNIKIGDLKFEKATA